MRVLICIFDALRPEFVTPELMPNLSAFAASGVQYTQSRAVFPTETRVNQSAVTTGCLPRKHGVVGNKMMAADLLPERMVDTGVDAALVEALAAGPVLQVPNMAERLHAEGKSFASLSAGTPGGGRLINHSAERIGSTRLAMNAPDQCWPQDLFDRTVRKLGPLPEAKPPAPAWIDWAVDAYLEVIEPEVAPDAMLLWLCEPDETFHWHGIGGPEARGIISHVDRAFGRILARHRAAIEAGEMQIIAMSDHGQLTLTGGHLDLPARLAEAGFTCSRVGLGEADCALALANGGGLWVRDPAVTVRIVEWLGTQDWCGPVFTRDGLGRSLPYALLGLDHPRAPDIALVCKADDGLNEHGLAGLSAHDAPYPVGGGCHGGLSPWELHNVLCLGGGAFRSGQRIDAPAGNIDILPTVMRLVGLPVPDDIDGRVLYEAFAEGGGAPDWSAFSETSSLAAVSGRRTAAGIYLDKAWRP
ncbi:MAG: alkaline phosphatase family protein [Pseudomonadota bacterium]